MTVARTIRALVTTGLFLRMPELQAQEDELTRIYAEARSAEAAGNYAAATKNYERIVGLRPRMAEAHANLGNLYYVQGLTEQAQASLQRAVTLKPGLFAPHLLLGVLSFNGRDFELATRHLTAAISLDPANVTANLYLGYTYYALSRHAESAEYLEKAVAQDDTNLDAWYHLSKVNGQLSKHYFEVLQQRYPNSFETHLARSHLYESSGNWKEAGEQLTRALHQQPGNRQLKLRMEWLERRAAGDSSPPPEEASGPLDGSTRYLHTPPVDDAVPKALAAEKSLILDFSKTASQTAASLYRLAEAHQSLSFLSSLRVLQIDPNSYRAHQLRAQSYEAAGRVDDAVKEYREVLALKPDLQTIHFAIGNLYWRHARLDEAIPELAAELKLNPRDPQAQYEMGDILFSQGNADAAEKHFEEAIRYQPSMEEAHLALERIATAKENYAKALAHLKNAAKIAPLNPTPHYRMWLLYRRLGKSAEALQARNTFEKLKKENGGQGTN